MLVTTSSHHAESSIQTQTESIGLQTDMAFDLKWSNFSRLVSIIYQVTNALNPTNPGNFHQAAMDLVELNPTHKVHLAQYMKLLFLFRDPDDI